MKELLAQVELVQNGKIGQFTTAELEILLQNNLGNWSGLDEKIKFEIQKRQTFALIKELETSSKYQRLLALMTGLLAIATFALVVITFFK